MINEGADVNHSNKECEIALIRGAGTANILYVLLAAGADVNMKDKDSKDALHHATRLNKCRSIEILLKAGADVNGRDEAEETPLITTAWHACDVSESESAKCLDMLIKAGADVNAKKSDGETVLIFIALYDHMKSMEALIEAGSRCECRQKYRGEDSIILCFRIQMCGRIVRSRS